MKTTDFMNNVTVEGLNAQLRKTYGISVDIAKYSKDQLEDYSKKIEAKLIDFETKNNFNESTTNEGYQKTLLIKKIVEAAMNQYIETPLEIDDVEADIDNVTEADADVARDFTDDVEVTEGDNIYHPCTKSFKHDKFGEGEVLEGEHTLAEDGTVTHYDAKFTKEDGTPFIVRNIPVANMKECVIVEHGHAPKKKKVKKEDVEKVEKVINEGEEDKAALVMAAKDMVDRFTSFLEDVAEMSAEGMLDIQDQIRDEMGAEQAEAFAQVVAPALEATMENLKTSREALTQGVGIITGEEAPTDTIGAEPEGDIEEPMDAEVPAEEPMDAEAPADDEFGASDAATGGTEPAGREKRESYQTTKKPVTESVRIFKTLSK